MSEQLLHQVASVVGAACILVAYALLQMGKLGRETRLFNALNFIGSSILAWIAIVDRRVGFIILEVVWALISLPGLLRAPRPTPARPD
jgi:hypothetical protein